MTTGQMLVDLAPPTDHQVPDTHVLSSAWAKYNRAVEHYRELSRAALALITATSEQGTIGQERINPLETRFFAKLPPIEPRLSSIVGDVVHGLRTALDHAVWALALRKGPPSKPRRVSFPICQSQDDFNERRGELETFLQTDSIAVIEKLQPFNGRTGLQWLQDLDNVDKHEALVVVRHRLLLTSLVITDSETGEPRLQHSTGVPKPIDVTDGGEVFRLHQPVEGVPRLKIKADFESALALVAARSWPQDRLDLILRQAMCDVEDSLLDMQSHIDGPGPSQKDANVS